ncbi:MAG: imidazole glycerol phosphate synthase subunit HisF [Candidatus Magasanikbacteria bacterium RIFOXYD2_FULL_41_14]|uniref:Imidazole glycerol phosphate synthase subunit HisF n=1 Tax=Candidatus Magasanikbacteria bacterium RIFOXYD2_FULL_41_14 TaxID=1798709 RepID=A0A1F6PEQ5_9BACT|nr:MAG: imidazole glycerol phosphate synthase subunit HisF [Candidatus Magasanikbacteria bacterium RIFOXYD2_FULL_41_14]
MFKYFSRDNLAKRIIPCLDIKDGLVVKGKRFQELAVIGDAVELAKSYSQNGADELVFLDIAATIEKRKTLITLVQKIAKNINIPFTVGGGINSLADVKKLLAAGADKVSLGSAAVRNPNLVKQIARRFGSQCLVISLDAKRYRGGWRVFIDSGRKPTGIDAVGFARLMEKNGAGELLVNSLDRDGTKRGFDVELLKIIAETVKIPVIASSGAGSKQDFLQAITLGKADAVLAASVFHYGQIGIKELKKYLKSKNINVRI